MIAQTMFLNMVYILYLKLILNKRNWSFILKDFWLLCSYKGKLNFIIKIVFETESVTLAGLELAM